MKKVFYYTFLILILHTASKAQNYQCFQHNNNLYWYVNHMAYYGKNYLRCIRIDSFAVLGSDTIYYPLRQFRLNNSTSLGDSSGASWLGDTVIEQPSGTFLFNNEYNDTVVIQTQAHLGDSWIFYNDSGSQYIIESPRRARPRSGPRSPGRAPCRSGGS